ncbi:MULTISPECIES: hypothetical protein [unclassified Arthrobacter]|uniref:hypothetical protein n=1 Tax=unclassified Arthrobacter TaxID=235627 RepID=UPI002E0844F0|nr:MULTISPECIES: hypothetical protein [unclassified Arthrobacter]MEC5190224.1 hypothetical protein [Arthrobacter sp. MP_M4]MEC5201692.1 hypothetical protein [Arthrobacter sp. MP_M7]
MPLDQLFAILACALLAGLAVFQVVLIAGAPLGRAAWGGQHRVLPAKLRIGSAVSIAVYALFAYAALAKVGLVPVLVSESFTAITMWVMTAYFVLGVLMNGISRSKPERLIMTPTTFALAALYLILAFH